MPRRPIDHRQAVTKSEKEARAKKAAVKAMHDSDREWWLQPDEDIPHSVAGVLDTIRERNSRLESQRLLSARLYGNLSLFGLQGMSISRATAMQPAVRDRITYNVTASAIDTVTSKMAKNKPKPLFLTDGGDFKKQRQAKNLTKFSEGLFYENRVRKMAPRTFKEAGVLGDGFVEVFGRFDRVMMRRTLCHEIYVDDIEAFYGEPRQMHRAMNIDRRVLCEVLPESKDDIVAADAAVADQFSGADAKSIADQVSVVQSWHLPSSPDAKDGACTICLPEKLLYKGEWKHDFFPFARFPWSPPLYGFWSRSCAESIQNIQLEMNKLLWLIQRSMHLMGTFKIALEYGSRVQTGHLTNDIGAIIWFSQTQPVYLTPQVVPAEYYQHFERLKAAAYDQAGISELSATSEKPAGLNSGKALREYEDIGSDRFQTVGQQYEEFHLDLARIGIATAQDIQKRTGKPYQVKVPGRRSMSIVPLEDIEEDDYVMQCYPISSLPHDPAGRTQQVQEWAQAGIIPQQMVAQLLDFPDLDEYDSISGAMLDYAQMVLDDIVDEGKYQPPDPALGDFDFARQTAQMYYLRGRAQGLEEGRLEMLQEWMSQLDLLKAKSMLPPVVGPGAGVPGLPAGQPQAVPEAPPQSPLLPNAPTA